MAPSPQSQKQLAHHAVLRSREWISPNNTTNTIKKNFWLQIQVKWKLACLLPDYIYCRKTKVEEFQIPNMDIIMKAIFDRDQLTEEQMKTVRKTLNFLILSNLISNWWDKLYRRVIWLSDRQEVLFSFYDIMNPFWNGYTSYQKNATFSTYVFLENLGQGQWLRIKHLLTSCNKALLKQKLTMSHRFWHRDQRGKLSGNVALLLIMSCLFHVPGNRRWRSEASRHSRWFPEKPEILGTPD